MAPGGASGGALEGRSFAGYRVGQAIASGGMATVFMARRTGPGRFAQTVALKVIHPHLARNRELVEMFQDEARLASCVNHPNVCRVLDFGEAEGTFFLAMEYVRGDTWERVLGAFRAHREARLRLMLLTAHVLAHACEGLHAIHEAVDPQGRPLRIVHRDVSPHNLLIAYDGSVRLLDFGIASAEGRAHTSGSEVVRGRYPYMAPEQMRGMDVDRRADVWSLGVILREAVSGQNPFARDTQIGTMLAVTQDPVPPWPGEVPLMLREIADRALTRSPDERFADARQLGNALTHYLKVQAAPALGAELAHFMRQLFADEIMRTRAAQRQLAGDDPSGDVFSSTFPAQPTPPRDTDSCLTGPLSNQPARPRPAVWRSRIRSVLLATLLFSVSLLGSWYLADRGSAPSATGGASRLRATTSAPAEKPGASGSAAEPRAAPALSSERTREDDKDAGNAGPLPVVESLREAPRAGRTHRERAAAVDDDEASELGATGTLVIGTTQGWAEIFADGRRLGTTPLRVELPSGVRALEVKPYGASSPRRVSIDIKPGEMNKLRLEL